MDTASSVLSAQPAPWGILWGMRALSASLISHSTPPPTPDTRHTTPDAHHPQALPTTFQRSFAGRLVVWSSVVISGLGGCNLPIRVTIVYNLSLCDFSTCTLALTYLFTHPPSPSRASCAPARSVQCAPQLRPSFDPARGPRRRRVRLRPSPGGVRSQKPASRCCDAHAREEEEDPCLGHGLPLASVRVGAAYGVLGDRTRAVRTRSRTPHPVRRWNRHET